MRSSISPAEWPNTAEQRYARRQVALAEYYDLEIESHLLDTDAVGQIHYLTAGNPTGEPVLLLHGATGQAAYWLPLLETLTDNYRFYAPDMPGEGLSVKVSYRDRDHRSFLTQYLVEFIDTMELGRPSVVGHSFGGAQAFLLAIDHDRVDRLCLLGAPVGLSRDYPIMIRLLSIQGLNRLLLWALHRGDSVANARQWIGLFVEDDSAIPDEYLELYAARETIPGLHASLRSLMTELGRFGRVRSVLDFREEVESIGRPTTFIWGSNDYYWNPELGRSVARQMPNATFHELDAHGHTPWLEPTDKAESHVQTFLEET